MWGSSPSTQPGDHHRVPLATERAGDRRDGDGVGDVGLHEPPRVGLARRSADAGEIGGERGARVALCPCIDAVEEGDDGVEGSLANRIGRPRVGVVHERREAALPQQPRQVGGTGATGVGRDCFVVQPLQHGGVAGCGGQRRPGDSSGGALVAVDPAQHVDDGTRRGLGQDVGGDGRHRYAVAGERTRERAGAPRRAAHQHCHGRPGHAALVRGAQNRSGRICLEGRVVAGDERGSLWRAERAIELDVGREVEAAVERCEVARAGAGLAATRDRRVAGDRDRRARTGEQREEPVGGERGLLVVVDEDRREPLARGARHRRVAQQPNRFDEQAGGVDRVALAERGARRAWRTR